VIILDTNVLSELSRAEPHVNVLTFASLHEASAFYTTALSAAELLYGVAALPEGKRRRRLSTAVNDLLGETLAGRVLAFNEGAAPFYAQIADRRRRSGRAPAVIDTQIAAIAALHGAPLATRNIRDFEDLGIELINPWQEA